MSNPMIVGGFYAAAVLLATLAFVAASPEALVKEICELKRKPSHQLASVDELAEVVKVVQGGRLQCSPWIESAIVDLHNLIHDHEHDVCSQASADDIAYYHGQYLANKDAETKKTIEFPKAMKRFYIAYGLKVSSFCRKQAIDLLVENSNRSLSRSDFDELSQFVANNGYIGLFVIDPADEKSSKDLVLPTMFVKMMSSIAEASRTSEEKLLLELATTTQIDRIQALCERRFKPIYKDLILPLVTLSDVGFNYKGHQVNRDQTVNKHVYEWYRLVFLCETMNQVELVQMPEDKLKAAADSSRMLVGVVSKEEAKQLREGRDKEIQAETGDLKQIEFEPELKSMPLDGLIYDKKDSELEAAVMKFKRQARRQNDPDLARRLGKVTKDLLSRGSMKVIRKWYGVKSLPGNGLNGVDFVNFVDEYVHAAEKGDFKAISGLLGSNTGFLGTKLTKGQFFCKYGWWLIPIAIVIWFVTYVGLHG